MRKVAWMAGLVLAVAAGSAAGVQLSVKKRLALYQNVTEDEVAWGREDADVSRVGRIDPAYFTRNPDRVEVVVFVRYTTYRVKGARYPTSTWVRSRRLTEAWRASLPDGVEVRRMPAGAEFNRKSGLAAQWPIHQEVFYAAQMLGVPEERVHDVLAREVGRNSFAMRAKRGRDRVARELGIDPDLLEHQRKEPEVVESVGNASRKYVDMVRAVSASVGKGRRLWLHPMLIVNGKFAVSASAIGDVGKTYRIANRLIREELERGRAHAGPTNDEEMAAWLAPRSGEVFSRKKFGKRIKFKGVYNSRRKEIWGLGEDGAYVDTSPLVGEGDNAYWRWFDPEKGRVHGHFWWRAREYVSYVDEAGEPQRYGAFLLTDYLSAPETLWVELPFKGRNAPFAFQSDGRVESRNEKGSIFGSWWLEAGDLKVSFGELGVESWPWQEAAEHVGFEVPRESLTPWKRSRKELARAAGDGK